MRQLRETLKKPLIFLLTIILCIGALFPIALPVKNAKALNELTVGDIVFVGMNSDDDDDIALLLLKDIIAGTQIYITDKGWNDGSGFNTIFGDGIWQWTASGGLFAGDVVRLQLNPLYMNASAGTISLIEDNGTEISSSGDQIFLYQGTHEAPVFIAGIHFNVESSTNEWNWDESSYSDNTSALPDVLSSVNALWVYKGTAPPTERDNFMYNCSTTSGTPDELRTIINNVGLWDFDDTNSTPFNLAPTQFNFTVVPPDPPPTVTITSGESNPTNNSFSVTFTFDEDVSGFTQGDITVGNGSVLSFMNTVANRVWTADITPSADGTVTVDVPSGVCTDGVGNGNDAATQLSINYDGTSPTVAITSGESDPTNNTPFSVTFTFDEDVSGFTQGDITVGNGSASNFTNTVANRVWTADITPVTEGTVTVDVNTGVCTDAAGNGNFAASQFCVDYDETSPTAVITSGEGDPTNSSPFSVSITFDEAVSGFVIGDITVGNGSASNFTNTTPNRVWTADITPSGDGTVTVDVNAGVCTDVAGNGNDAATQFSLDYDGSAPTATISTTESDPTNESVIPITITFNEDVSGFVLGDIDVSNCNASNFTNTVANRVWTADITPTSDGTVTVDIPSGVCIDGVGNGNDAATQFGIEYDVTMPTIAITSGESDPTNNSPFSVTFTFNEDVSGFVVGDITVGNGSASNFTNTTPNRVWTADITPSGDGAVTIDVSAGACADGAGNCNNAASQFSLDYDGTSPTAVITSGEGDPTNSSPFSVTITFDEAVSGFVIGDITVGNGSASNFINTTPNRVWTADITPSGDGVVTVDVNAGVCTDAAGNGNDAATQLCLDYDGSAPIAMISTTESDPTNESVIPITITFNEDVSGFVLGDIDVSNGNASNLVNTVANRVWTADISPVAEGTVTVDVNAGVCTDAAGNGNNAASQFSIDYDGLSPTVAITSGESDPTNNAPFSVTFTFSEDVSGFVVGDIIVGNGSAGNFTNTTPNRVWTADITPSGDGAVTIDLSAGACADRAGNCNNAASQFSLDYDRTSPAVTVNAGLTVNEGGTETITTTELSAADTVADDTSIVYTVTDLPDNGVLKNNSAVLLLNGTFAQQDITDGKIEYSHDGSETTSDSFVFKVSDNVNETTAQTFSITVAPVNTPPLLSTTGFNPIFTEGGATVSLFGSTNVSTVEAGQMINALTLTVTNVVPSGEELLMIDGTSVVLSDGNSLITAVNSLSCTVGLSGNTATITLSGTLSCAQTQTLVNTIAYQNTCDAPTSSNRVVTITSIKDSGGTANGGDDTAMMSVTSTVTVVAVNDDPTILGLPTDISVDEDVASSVNLSSVTISDDSGENLITLTIEASAGTLSAPSDGGVTVFGSGTSCMILTGTVGNIDTYLNTVSNIKYTGPENVYGNDAAMLSLTANDGGNTGTGGGVNVGFGTVNVDIAEINDVPTVDVNDGLILNEGAAASIVSTKLTATDVETADGLLAFTVTSGPDNGQLENTDNPSVSISSFTQQNIIDGKIKYVHDGSNTTLDTFTFKVNDGEGGVLTGQTFSITVNAVDDDAPSMVKKEGLTLDKGKTRTINTTELLATDEDSADSLLIFTVTSEPLNGRLENSDYEGVSISIFTQQDLVDGKIRYVHDDSNTTSDSFTFNVADNNANGLSGQTFSITVNSAPVPTITPSPTQTPGEDTRTISGMLLDKEGNPKVGYVVELHSTPITAITDSQGRYRFDNVDYTAHTLFVKTPEGQKITSFALSFEEDDEFSKTVTTDGADIKYTNSTVSVEITIALDGDEDSAEITELSGVDNPATGRTLSMLVWVSMAAFAALIGWVVFRRIKARA